MREFGRVWYIKQKYFYKKIVDKPLSSKNNLLHSKANIPLIGKISTFFPHL